MKINKTFFSGFEGERGFLVFNPKSLIFLANKLMSEKTLSKEEIDKIVRSLSNYFTATRISPAKLGEINISSFKDKEYLTGQYNLRTLYYNENRYNPQNIYDSFIDILGTVGHEMTHYSQENLCQEKSYDKKRQKLIYKTIVNKRHALNGQGEGEKFKFFIDNIVGKSTYFLDEDATLLKVFYDNAPAFELNFYRNNYIEIGARRGAINFVEQALNMFRNNKNASPELKEWAKTNLKKIERLRADEEEIENKSDFNCSLFCESLNDIAYFADLMVAYSKLCHHLKKTGELADERDKLKYSGDLLFAILRKMDYETKKNLFKYFTDYEHNENCLPIIADALIDDPDFDKDAFAGEITSMLCEGYFVDGGEVKRLTRAAYTPYNWGILEYDNSKVIWNLLVQGKLDYASEYYSKLPLVEKGKINQNEIDFEALVSAWQSNRFLPDEYVHLLKKFAKENISSLRENPSFDNLDAIYKQCKYLTKLPIDLKEEIYGEEQVCQDIVNTVSDHIGKKDLAKTISKIGLEYPHKYINFVKSNLINELMKQPIEEEVIDGLRKLIPSDQDLELRDR